MNTEQCFKMKIVSNELRLYKFTYDQYGEHISLDYYIVNRQDLNRLTDIAIYAGILPYNGLVIRELIRDAYTVTA